MNPASPRVKLTYDDFVRFPDDGKRHELIDGEHYVAPSPDRRHQAMARNLYGHILVWLRETPSGGRSRRRLTSCSRTSTSSSQTCSTCTRESRSC